MHRTIEPRYYFNGINRQTPSRLTRCIEFVPTDDRRFIPAVRVHLTYRLKIGVVTHAVQSLAGGRGRRAAVWWRPEPTACVKGPDSPPALPTASHGRCDACGEKSNTSSPARAKRFTTKILCRNPCGRYGSAHAWEEVVTVGDFYSFSRSPYRGKIVRTKYETV